jgi:hypothetical protein
LVRISCNCDLYDKLHRIFPTSNNSLLHPNFNNPSVTSIVTLQLCTFPHWISVWFIFAQLQRSGFHHCQDPSVKKAPHRPLLLSLSFLARFLCAYVIDPRFLCAIHTGQSKVLTRTWTPLQTSHKFINLLSPPPTLASKLHNSSVSSPALSTSGVVLFLVAILQPYLPCADNACNKKVRVIDCALRYQFLPPSHVLSADLFTSGVVLFLVVILQFYPPCAYISSDETLAQDSVNVNITIFALVGCGLLPGIISTALPSLPTQVSRLRHCQISTSAATNSLHLSGRILLASQWLNPC